MFRVLRHLTDHTDLSLVGAFKKLRQPWYFQELFDRHHKRIFQICYHMVRDVVHSQDLVQETFTRALREIDRFDEKQSEANFERWLVRICKNLCLDEVRKARTRTLKESEIHSIRLAGPTSPETSLLVAELLEVLETLEDRYRICYLLFVVDGYTYEEIGAITGLSFDEVKSCIRTARRNLERVLERERSHG